jgi:hypothetical protein
VCKYWAAGTERAHEREQAILECDVPNNGTRRRSSGGELLREMQKRGSRIEDAAKVFDEMLTAGEVKLSLQSGNGSRMRAARTYADVMWQGRGECGLGNRRKKNNHAGRRRAGR